MAASPVTGERPAGFRRSSSQFASIPQRTLSFHEKVGLAKDDAAADVLYAHPSVRIYSFQPPTDALNSLDTTKKTLPDADYPIDAIEILPWRARTETLAARGKLIIEKVQGSVHFLKAGELIYTIMKNSQCWCVDGESKFVMRVGRLRYQRIEMPTAEPEDKQKVEEFKEVISKILKFEKTPCPFIRAFHVDLPEDAITPRRRGTWKRKESLTAVTPEDEPRSIQRTKTSRTMSMRGMPPSSFPSRSLTQLDMERPRTASTPTSTGRFSFPDVRTESPINYTSGEENTDSDRHDSESDRPGTGHSSEFDESDKESNSAPLVKSPLNNVETLHSITTEDTFRATETNKDNERSLMVGHAQKTTGITISPSNSEIAPSDLSFAPPSLPVSHEKEISQPPQAESSNCRHFDVQESALSEVATTTRTPAHPGTSELQEEKPQNSRLSVIAIEEGQAALEEPLREQESDTSVQGGTSQPQHSSDPFKSIQVDKSVADSKVNIADIALHAESGPLNEQELGQEETKEALAAPPKETKMVLPSNESASSTNDDDAESITSFDSFRTVPSDDETLASQQTFLGKRPFQHRRELSEMTVVAGSTHGIDELSSIPIDSTTELTVEIDEGGQSESERVWPEMHTPGAFSDGFEIRQRLQHRRSLSPLPPASILQTSNQVEQYSPIPAALLQKAATLAVVKPLEIFVFVVQVLARIAGGATMNDLVSGDLFRRPGVRRTASGTFDQAVRGRHTNTESDEEDDYGVPVHGRRKSSNKDENPGFAIKQDIDDAASFASID